MSSSQESSEQKGHTAGSVIGNVVGGAVGLAVATGIKVATGASCYPVIRGGIETGGELGRKVENFLKS